MITATHEITDYKIDLIKNFLRNVEGPIPNPYYDRAPRNTTGEYQNVTIGDGINLDWSNEKNLRLTLLQLGLVDSSTALEANRRNLASLPAETSTEKTLRLDAMVLAFRQVMINNRPAEGATPQSVLAANAALKTQLDNLATLFGGVTFQITEGQSENIIKQIINGISIPGFVIDNGKQARLDANIGSSLSHNTKEYEALMSLFYNAESTVKATGLLATAIKEDRRADAWYEIRYNTNLRALTARSDISGGIANRRYKESDLFDLYGDPSKLNDTQKLEEGKSIYRMFTSNREQIIRYEELYSPTNINAGSTAIEQVLGRAKLVVLANLENSSDSSIKAAYAAWSANAASFRSTDLYFDPGKNAVTVLDGRKFVKISTDVDAGISEAAVNNVLIGDGGVSGNTGDMLVGGMGNDLLIGSAGNDYLWGGKGDDAMAGGAGNDTYIIESGDGTDTIEDKVGVNRVIVNGKAIVSFYRKADGLNYVSYDGAFTAVLKDGDFIVTDAATGGKVILNQDFQEGDFGIHFADAPTDPAANPTASSTDRTILGDKRPSVFVGTFDAQLSGLPAGAQILRQFNQVADEDGKVISIDVEYNKVDDLGNLITDAPEPGRSDNLNDSAGNDRIEAGSGDDGINASRGGNDYIDAGEGNDTVDAGAGNDYVLGGAGNDKLNGDDGNDYLQGDAGDDTLNGNKGNDLLLGGDGEDQLNGGDGDDTIRGGADHDVLRGDSADATTPGKDVLEGGSGSDILYGMAGDDALYGADFIKLEDAIAQGNSGTGSATQGDFLQGMGGNDILVGTSAKDLLGGGEGSDVLVGGAGDDFLFGDVHHDAYTKDWSFRLETTGDAQTGRNYEFKVDGVTSTSSDGAADTIYAGAGDDGVMAGGGDDYVDAGAGNDVVFGEGGDDNIQGGDGDDVLNGDNGIGMLALSKHGNDFIDGGAGNDDINGEGGNDVLFGGAGNDKISGDGSVGAAGGDDYLDGGEGDDQLFGGAGNDIIYGGSGNDILMGDAGADFMDGGDGDDTYVAGVGDTISDSKGNNTLTITDGNPLAVTASGDTLILDYGTQGTVEVNGALTGAFSSINGVAFGNWISSRLTDSVQVSTTQANQTVTGGSGDDALTAYHAGANLNGGNGNDTLAAGEFSAVLNGGAGDDALYSGAGADTLNGGSGADTYYFYRGNGADVIEDSGDASDVDTLIFGDDILASDVTVRRTPAGDLEFTVNGTADSVTIKDWYSASSALNRIEQIVFGDGAIYSPLDYEGLPITGTADADSMVGSSSSDVLVGLAGTDTYYMQYNMGKDRVVDSVADGGVVQLAEGLSFSSVTAQRYGSDLLLQLDASNSLRIDGYFATSQPSWFLKDGQGETKSFDDLSVLPDPATAIDEALVVQSEELAYRNKLEADIRFHYATLDVANFTPYQTRSDGTLYSQTENALNGWTQTGTRTSGYMDIRSGYAPYYFGESSSSYSQAGIYGGASVEGDLVEIRKTTSNTDEDVFYAAGEAQTLVSEYQSKAFQINWNEPYYSAQSAYTNPPSFVGYITWSGINSSESVPVDQRLGIRYFYSAGSDLTSYFTGKAVGLPLAPIDATSTDSLPGYANFAYREITTLYSIQTLNLGASDNTVYAGSLTIVNSGDGNDTVYNAGYAYGGAGNDSLIGGGTLRGGEGDDFLRDGNWMSGGAGDDILVGGATMVAGAGHDEIYARAGYARIEIDPAVVTSGLLGGAGDSTYFLDQYYQSIGITNWEMHSSTPGIFHLKHSDIGNFWGTREELKAIAELNSWTSFEEGLAEGWIYAPLPPAPLISANDFRALASYYEQGVLQHHVVAFGAGVSAQNLRFSWGELQAAVSGEPSAPKSAHVVLNISWNDGQQNIQVIIPHSDDPIGSGISQFTFADGAVLGMADILELAPTPPSFDPQALFDFVTGSGETNLTSDVKLLRFDLSASELVVKKDGADLLLTLAGSSDSVRLLDWCANPDAYFALNIEFGGEPVQGFQAYLQDVGIVIDGSAGGQTLTGVAGYPNTFIAGPGSTLIGSEGGQDTYVINAGSGTVHIQDSEGTGTIQFGAGITPDQITLGVGSLMLRVGNSGDTIHIEGFDPQNALGSSAISAFQFSDGTTLTVRQLMARGFDIYGTEDGEVLRGTDQDDRIYSAGGNDTLIGGVGDDTLIAGVDANVFAFQAGDGRDVIDESAKAGTSVGTDLIKFTSGVAASDLFFGRTGSDVLISNVKTQDALVVRNIRAIDRIALDNGSYVEFRETGPGSASITTYDIDGLILSSVTQTHDGNGNFTNVGPNGAISGGGSNPDGSYYLYTDDGDGGAVTTNYDGNGSFVSETSSWEWSDGSHGTSTRYADGTSAATAYYIDPDDADGYFSGSTSYAYNNNGRGLENWIEYDAGGALLGSVSKLTQSTPNTYTTTAFDATGRKIEVRWGNPEANGNDLYHADGTSSGGSYFRDGSGHSTYFNDGAGTITTQNFDATDALLGKVVVTDDEQGNTSTTNFDANDVKVNASWIKSDGSYGSTAFNPDGSGNGTANYLDGSFEEIYYGALSGFAFNYAHHYDADRNYLGRWELYDYGGGETQKWIYDANDVLIGGIWTDRDGGYSEDVYAADGSFVNTRGNGKGLVTVTNYDADEVPISVSWTNIDGSYGSGTLDADGILRGTGHYPDGRNSTFVQEPSGVLTTDFFDANGVFLNRQIENAWGYTRIEYFDAAGNLIEEHWRDAYGAYGIKTFQLDGSSSGTSYYPDGSYETFTDDGHGSSTGHEYSADGTELSYWWGAPDGSYGYDDFDASGAISGGVYNVDGSHKSYTNDGHGNITTQFFDPDNNLLSYVVVSDDGQGNVHTSTFDATGNLISEAWQHANSAPEANPITAEAAQQGALYTFHIPSGSFTDPDIGDVLSYSANLSDGTALPAWLTFDAQTQTFSGTPQNADVGQLLSIEITATDPLGESVSQTFTLNVSNVNDAPMVQEVLIPQAAQQGVEFSYTLPQGAFSDIDVGDSLSYSVELADGTALPDWLHFDAETRTLSGTPANEDVGSLALKVTATDAGGLSASQIVSLDVSNVNDAPVADSSITSQNAAEDSLWSYVISADAFTDVDVGDSLSYSVTLASGSPLPSWLSFDAATRTLSGTPTNDDVGHLLLKVVATDSGGLSASQAFGLNVTNVNDAPQIVLIVVDQTAVEQQAFSYTVPSGAFVDVDAGDTLSYSLSMADGSALPMWLFFDAATRTLSGTPTWGSVGGLDLLLTATDLADASASQTLHILVQSRSGTTTTVVGTDGNDELNFYYSGASGVIVKGLGGDDVLVGTEGADYLFGGDGVDQLYSWEDDDYIDGGGGDDNIAGELGNDMLLGGTGNDSVYGGAGNDMIYGQDGEDFLTGADGDDYLDGGADYDNVNGGAGNDTLLGGAGGDVLYGDEGNDILYGQDGDDYMGGNDGDDTLYGDAGADWLVGGVGADILDGGTGADFMEGGDSNDTYYVDDANDSMQENANAGIDTVISTVTHTLSANVENLTLAGTSAINGTGNALSNVIIGNSAANTLNGGAGADTMIGGAGDDLYVVDNVGDVVTELSGEGVDLVNSSITYTLGSNLENLTLTGTGVINGTGNALDNVLIGNSKANVLTGGAGNDTYIVGTGDTTIEAAGEGVDTVQSSIAWTLANNVENLVLTGTSAINGTGNALDNVLTGNSGVNVLTGGAGNDTYIVGTGDTTTEAAGGGTDTVQSSVTWTLATNVENLTLTGTAAVNGTGNTADNLLLGNTGANTLTGNAGNDTLDGGAGADILVGGTGNDTYWLGRGYGTDTIQENDVTAGNTDLAKFGADIATDQLWFRQVGNNLEISVIGSGDAFTVKDWYLGSQYHVEQFKTADGKTLLDSQVQNLVQAMAGFAPPAAGQTTLPQSYESTLNPVIAANWQ